MANPHLIVTSFGYGHETPPPAAHVTVDVRTWFRDPHIAPELRQLTGKDAKVIAKVLATPGVTKYLLAQQRAIEAVLYTGVDVSFAVGCVGGRHRSVVIADQLAMWFASDGWRVDVEHRDIGKNVIKR